MVYGFVKQSGGRIRIEGVPRVGTSVKLFLPRHVASRDRRKDPTSARGSAPMAARNILVVEDNENVRGMAVSRLKALGHTVFEADIPSKALAFLEEAADIDLLFTDVVMPGGMNGFDLARKAAERRPDLKVIFVSGYAPSLHLEDGPGLEFLQKPYSEEELVHALRGVFGEVERRNAAKRKPSRARKAN
jgi:CheY-like chemotaxis protein